MNYKRLLKKDQIRPEEDVLYFRRWPLDARELELSLGALWPCRYIASVACLITLYILLAT